jgi:hypothetical protein
VVGGPGSTRWKGYDTRLTIDEVPSVSAASVRMGNVGSADSVFGPRELTGTMAALLEAVPQPMGGVRWWLRCPSCHFRRVRLFVVAKRLRCRVCADLAYPSQRCDSAARWCRRMAKLLRVAGASIPTDNIFALDGPEIRPHGMWRRTFERLVKARQDLIYERDAWLLIEIIRRFSDLIPGGVSEPQDQ